MIQPEIVPAMPGQIIVLGGGLTPEGGPTQETAERARTAAYYALEFGAERVIFSGGESLLVSGKRSGLSEADVMADIAVERGLHPGYIRGLDRNSRSTFETFLNVKPLLADETTAVVTHAYHQPRALYMGRLTLSVPLVGIEAMAQHNGKAKAPFNERLLQLVTWAAMLDVQQGDTEQLRERNDRVVRLVGTPARLKLLSSTLLKNHASVRALKAKAASTERSNTDH